jgi:hypothetical protein
MRKVVFAINITADGFCNHTDGIADEELHDFYTRLLRNASLKELRATKSKKNRESS